MEKKVNLEEQLKISVNLIKEKLSKNLASIKNTEVYIKKVLAMPLSERRDSILSDSFKTNRMMIEENNELLGLQRMLTTYLAKYKVYNKTDEINPDKCFEDIISGKVSFNNLHPLYKDKKFRKRLLEYYSKHENYEMCAHIMKTE